MIDFRVFVVIFVASKSPYKQKGEAARYTGLFLCPEKYSGSLTPRTCCNGICKPFCEDFDSGKLATAFYLASKSKTIAKCLPKDSRNRQATPGTFPSDQQPGLLTPSFTKSLRSPFTGLWRQSAFSSSKSLNSSRHIPTTPNSTRPETVLNTCIYLKKYAHG